MTSLVSFCSTSTRLHSSGIVSNVINTTVCGSLYTYCSFAVDFPIPTELKKARSEPLDKMPKSLVGSRQGSLRGMSNKQNEFGPKTDVGGIGAGRGDPGPTTTPGTTKRRVSIFDIFQENEEFTTTILNSLTAQQLEVLRMLSMVPSSFDMEYVEYCWNQVKEKYEGKEAIVWRRKA